jgi:hypothetical protein
LGFDFLTLCRRSDISMSNITRDIVGCVFILVFLDRIRETHYHGGGRNHLACVIMSPLVGAIIGFAWSPSWFLSIASGIILSFAGVAIHIRVCGEAEHSLAIRGIGSRTKSLDNASLLIPLVYVGLLGSHVFDVHPGYSPVFAFLFASLIFTLILIHCAKKYYQESMTFYAVIAMMGILPASTLLEYYYYYYYM